MSGDPAAVEFARRRTAASRPSIAATARLLAAQMRHSACPLALDSLLDSIAELAAITVPAPTAIP